MAAAATMLMRRPPVAAPRLLAGQRQQQPQLQRQRPRRRRSAPLVVTALFSTQTSNPAFTMGGGSLSAAIQERSRRGDDLSRPMTVDGVINKAGLCLGLSLLSAAYTWLGIFSGSASAVMGALSTAKAAGLVGLVAGIAGMFKPQWAKFTAPTYALAKGCALAGMSAVLEMQYPGIALNTVVLTFSTAASLFIGLRSGVIRVGERFADTVRAVTGAYFVAILLTFLASLVGVQLPGVFSGGPVALCVHLVASGLAASNLLLDMDYIRQAARQRVPAMAEWSLAQGLMFSLVWLYIELLRTLATVAGMGRRDD